MGKGRGMIRGKALLLLGTILLLVSHQVACQTSFSFGEVETYRAIRDCFTYTTQAGYAYTGLSLDNRFELLTESFSPDMVLSKISACTNTDRTLVMGVYFTLKNSYGRELKLKTLGNDDSYTLNCDVYQI